MAAKPQVESLREYLICPACLDIFTDPVSLQCGHNFCGACITQCWEREGRNSCPECGEEFADSTLIVNWALSSLAEKTHKLKLNQKETENKFDCEKHQEELKLFCETDKKLVCVICRDAREHREHRFIPIEEAAENYKAQMKSSMESLTKKKSEIQEMEQMQKRKISGVREQSRSLQSHITSQFTQKRQILAEEEQRLLKALRKAEAKSLDRMEKNLQSIQQNLNSMQEKLTKLQERIDQKDSVIFLMEEISRRRRVSDEEHTLSVADGAKRVAKFDHPYLLNRVLPKMACIPQGWTCVLGSEGFTSGRHYWEVEVAGSQGWSLGVAAESVQRKGAFTLIPENGVWNIRRRDDVFDTLTYPLSHHLARLNPRRVGVYLSYESGTVSFYDADTKSHLHTFTGNKFTEKLYPHFWIWKENQWLGICSDSRCCCVKGLSPGSPVIPGFNILKRLEKLSRCGNIQGAKKVGDVSGRDPSSETDLLK